MRKYIICILIMMFMPLSGFAENIYSVQDLAQMGIVANDSISETDLEFAKKVINNVHKKTEEGVLKGKGPFYAEIYDSNGNFVAGCSNSVVKSRVSSKHAEMNTITYAHKKYKKYDLSKENLSIYINAEPCVMCMGAIMWSGIKRIFYSVPSSEVENITGFDEGYKPKWISEFKERGISVYGNIESENGRKVLEKYVTGGHEIYKPAH